MIEPASFEEIQKMQIFFCFLLTMYMYNDILYISNIYNNYKEVRYEHTDSKFE